jgi:hypothetical protein
MTDDDIERSPRAGFWAALTDGQRWTDGHLVNIYGIHLIVHPALELPRPETHETLGPSGDARKAVLGEPKTHYTVSDPVTGRQVCFVTAATPAEAHARAKWTLDKVAALNLCSVARVMQKARAAAEEAAA